MKEASKYFGFIFLTALLMIVYIANTHRAERKLRKIIISQKSVDDAKSQLQKVRSDNTFNGTETQLAKKLRNNGFKINSEPLMVINISH